MKSLRSIQKISKFNILTDHFLNRLDDEEITKNFIRFIKSYHFLQTFFLFGNLTSIAHDLMHFFDTRKHYDNITFQYHHQEQSSFRCAENTEVTNLLRLVLRLQQQSPHHFQLGKCKPQHLLILSTIFQERCLLPI